MEARVVSFGGTEQINANPEKVWAFLMDTKRFTACAPRDAER
jgi:carbon monoxide dehydrogenase subunit G